MIRTSSPIGIGPGRGRAMGRRFRRFASLAMRLDVAMVLGFAAIDAVGNLLAGRLLPSAWGREFAFGIVEFGPALIVVRLGRRWIDGGRPLALSRLALCIAAAAAFSGVVASFRDSVDWLGAASAFLGSLLPYALLVGAMELHARAARAQARAHEARQGNARLEAELQEARVRLLEAQIEPHFLFNTLANIRQLGREDPSAGIEMLTDLIEYLETSLPSLRSESTTLEQERALLDAYLRLHRPRFGPRLRFDISFPEALLRCRLPSMVLLTLVENSIRHGLAPSPEGGTIQLSAEAAGPALLVTVADTGAGMGAGSGGGTGLANVRSRLALRYGDAAGLTLSLNEPRGVRASLRLPLTSELAA
jgi:hypothetical protein